MFWALLLCSPISLSQAGIYNSDSVYPGTVNSQGFVPSVKSQFFMDMTWTPATKARGSQPFASCHGSVFAQIPQLSKPPLWPCTGAPGNFWIHCRLLESHGELGPSVLAPSLHPCHGMKLQTALGASPGGLMLFQSMRPEKWAAGQISPCLFECSYHNSLINPMRVCS